MPDYYLPLPQHPEMHTYEVLPRSDKGGVNLISDALPFGRLWYGEPNAVSNVIETHESAGDFREP